MYYQFQPLPGVGYRIQNVNSGKFLQLDRTNSVEVAAAERYDRPAPQQWKFTRTARNTYKIVNAAFDSDNYNMALSYDSLIKLAKAEDEDVAPGYWNVEISPNMDYCWIIAKGATEPGSKDYLEHLNIQEPQIFAMTANNLKSQMWRILPGLPTEIVRNQYRIYNLDTGTALTADRNHTAPWLAIDSTSAHNQLWEIIRIEGGDLDYHIKHSERGYLSYPHYGSASDGFYMMGLKDQPDETTKWSILAYGPFDYCIFPKIKDKNLSLSCRADAPMDPPSQDLRGQRWRII